MSAIYGDGKMQSCELFIIHIFIELRSKKNAQSAQTGGFTAEKLAKRLSFVIGYKRDEEVQTYIVFRFA